mmetsp:Transcript_29852/g.75116  ORF Transcript_29852/g.75116 Transcript_29852/m.75116 type:complete len:296 (+) Transcript_29852:41-928(+)
MELCSLAHGRCPALVLLAAACLLGSASAAHAAVAGRRAPGAGQVQLRASPTAPPAAANATEAAADAEQRNAIVAAFRSVADVSSPEENHQQGKEEEESGPVTMQVPEKELQEFIDQLSTRCKSQFSDILGGKSELHTFGDGGVRSKETCTDLKGSLCSMNAQVTQKQESSGRKLKQVTEVTGKSCLPRDCMAENDLKVLAKFMKLKARDSMGTMHNLDIDINLQVDCSASGGKSADALGKIGDTAPAEGRQPNENTVENNVVRPSSMRSAASTRGPLCATAAATFAAVVSAITRA